MDVTFGMTLAQKIDVVRSLNTQWQSDYEHYVLCGVLKVQIDVVKYFNTQS